jgi:hypothetical protein
MMGRQAAFILIAGLCALAAGHAQADCASECAYTYGGYGSYNFTTCYRLNCTNKKSFGAIAFGAASDAYGYSWGKASPGDGSRPRWSIARPMAMTARSSPISPMPRRCGGVEAKNCFTVGQGNSRTDAQNSAMKSCGSEIGGKCEIEVWTCSTP